MGSVSSTNPGLANLLQTLTNVDSPLMSSPSAVSAIENSSPADIVKLSAAAMQLQEVSTIFGGPESTPESLINGSSEFTDLENALTSPALATSQIGSTPSTSTSATAPTSTTNTTAIPTSQLPEFQSSLQASEADALLDPGPTASSASSLFSVLG